MGEFLPSCRPKSQCVNNAGWDGSPKDSGNGTLGAGIADVHGAMLQQAPVKARIHRCGRGLQSQPKLGKSGRPNELQSTKQQDRSPSRFLRPFTRCGRHCRRRPRRPSARQVLRLSQAPPRSAGFRQSDEEVGQEKAVLPLWPPTVAGTRAKQRQ